MPNIVSSVISSNISVGLILETTASEKNFSRYLKDYDKDGMT